MIIRCASLIVSPAARATSQIAVAGESTGDVGDLPYWWNNESDAPVMLDTFGIRAFEPKRVPIDDTERFHLNNIRKAE